MRGLSLESKAGCQTPRTRESLLTKNVNDLRLLQVVPRVPWPLDTGAKLRNYHLARALATRMNVTLLAFGELPSTRQLNEVYQRIVTVPRNESYSINNMLRGAVGPAPLPLLNYTTTEMKETLAGLLAEDSFDLIQVESIHLMNYLPLLRAVRNHPPVVCD